MASLQDFHDVSMMFYGITMGYTFSMVFYWISMMLLWDLKEGSYGISMLFL